MTTNTSIGLSRRTILTGLGSLGAIGIAGRVGSGLQADSQRFPRHTLATSHTGDTDLLVTWQQWYSPTDDARRPVNAHPDDDGDGVQSYAGTTYDVAAGESALQGAANACCDFPDGTYAVEQPEGSLPLSDALAFQGEPDESVGGFFDAISGSPDFEEPGVVRTLLYSDDDGRLYLVVLLGDPPSGEGTTVTFDVPGGLPDAGSWIVTGDGTFGADRVSLQWTAGGNGGVYGPIEPPFSPILVEPDFSNATGAGWQFLSADADDTRPSSRWTPLDVDRPVRIATHCGVASGDDVPVPEVFRSDAVPGQTALVELSDVVPGDSGEIVFDVTSCNTNEGVYVWLLGTAFEESPGVTTDPEADLGTDEAILAESVMLDVRYTVNRDGDVVWEEEPPVFAPGVGGYTEFGGGNAATLAAAAGVLGRGSVLDDVLGGATVIPLDGAVEGPDDVLGWDEGAESDSRDCLATDDVLSVRVEWEIPTAVGNEIQGDEAGFSLGFYAEQCSNNEKTINGSV